MDGITCRVLHASGGRHLPSTAHRALRAHELLATRKR
jgi:hypothetical protein